MDIYLPRQLQNLLVYTAGPQVLQKAGIPALLQAVGLHSDPGQQASSTTLGSSSTQEPEQSAGPVLQIDAAADDEVKLP